MTTYTEAYQGLKLTENCAFQGESFEELMKKHETYLDFRPFVIARLHGKDKHGFEKIDCMQAIRLIDCLGQGKLGFYKQADFVCLEKDDTEAFVDTVLESCKPEAVSEKTKTFVIASTIEKSDRVYQARQKLIDEYSQQGNQKEVRRWLGYITLDFPADASSAQKLLGILENSSSFIDATIASQLKEKLAANEKVTSNAPETAIEIKTTEPYLLPNDPPTPSFSPSGLPPQRRAKKVQRSEQKSKPAVDPKKNKIFEKSPSLSSRIKAALSSCLPCIRKKAESARSCCASITGLFSRAMGCLPASPCRKKQELKEKRMPTALTLKKNRSHPTLAKARVSESHMLTYSQARTTELQTIDQVSTALIPHEEKKSLDESTSLADRQVIEFSQKVKELDEKFNEMAKKSISRIASIAAFFLPTKQFGVIPKLVVLGAGLAAAYKEKHSAQKIFVISTILLGTIGADYILT